MRDVEDAIPYKIKTTNCNKGDKNETKIQRRNIINTFTNGGGNAYLLFGRGKRGSV